MLRELVGELVSSASSLTSNGKSIKADQVTQNFIEKSHNGVNLGTTIQYPCRFFHSLKL